jgi:hypothetical protein
VSELTIRQASKAAQELGHPIGITYLNRLARTKPEVLGARFVEQPTGSGYWLIDQDKLINYCANTRSRGKKQE